MHEVEREPYNAGMYREIASGTSPNTTLCNINVCIVVSLNLTEPD